MVLEVKYISAMLAAIAHSTHIEVPISSFSLIDFRIFGNKHKDANPDLASKESNPEAG